MIACLQFRYPSRCGWVEKVMILSTVRAVQIVICGLQ